MGRYWGAHKKIWIHYALSHFQKYQPRCKYWFFKPKILNEKVTLAKFENNAKTFLINRCETRSEERLTSVMA